jgi:polysaccharide biosynthesis transport protein
LSDPADIPDNRSTLGDQLQVLRRRWRLVALLPALAVAASLAYSLMQPPQYRASTEVLLAPTTFDVQRGGSDITPEEVATQVRVVTSRPVAELVRDDLRLAQTPVLEDLVTVEAVGNARVLRITARAREASDAGALAESVADSYLYYRRTNTQRSLGEVAGVLTERQQQIETRIDRLDAALRGSPDRTGELEAERRNLLSQLGQLTSQLAGLDITVSAGAGGEVLTPLGGTAVKVAPRPYLNAGLSLLIGLLLGIAFAFLRDRLARVSHSAEAIERRLGEVMILRRVPQWRGDQNPIMIAQPDSRASQAMQSLFTQVRFRLEQAPSSADGGKVILCTSAESGEGKTEIAENLAVAAARVGLRVALVDADLRHPAESLTLAPPSSTGLTDVLEGDSLARILVAGPVEKLMILPSGDTSTDPSSLMVSHRMREVVQSLRERMDLVFLLTPPVVHYADALELTPNADLSILVCRVGKSRLAAVETAMHRLREVGSSSLGAVVIDNEGSKRSGSRSLRGR